METNDEDLWNLRKLFSEVPASELDMSSAGIAEEKLIARKISSERKDAKFETQAKVLIVKQDSKLLSKELLQNLC